MQTSRNPKVSNNVLKYKLRPILDKIAELEAIHEEEKLFSTNVRNKLDFLKEEGLAELEKFEKAQNSLYARIEKANKNLSRMIKNNLYNPNVATYEVTGGDDAEYIEDTKLITDKIINTCLYGIVKNHVDMTMYGFGGNGIILVERGTDIENEFDFRNPALDTLPFPTYYVTDMIAKNTGEVLIATNSGIVYWDMATDDYVLCDISYGLPSNRINRIVKVSTKEKDEVGFLALTDRGIAYSPNGMRWKTVNKKFLNPCTCVSSIHLIDTPQSIVFIGGNAGIFYFDADAYIKNGDNELKQINGLNYILPTAYINGISYDEETDVLAVATMGGLSIVKKVKEIIRDGITLNASLKYDKTQTYYALYTITEDLSSTTCNDVMWTQNHKLLVATTNGLNVTNDLIHFNLITRNRNTENPESEERLNSYICVRIVRKGDNEYTILHSVGLTDSIHIY